MKQKNHRGINKKLKVLASFLGASGLKLQTAIASEYYRNFPDLKNKKIIIIDPMLVTGGSAISTIDSLIEEGGKVENMQFACIISAPEGLSNLQNKHSQINIITCALDKCLNDKKDILPGLGDAGDLWAG